PNFKALLKDGSDFGVRLSYCEQPTPDGLAQAFLLAEDFIAGDSCALVLGDNIFYGNGLGSYLSQAVSRKHGATVFGFHVDTPEQFGILEFDENGRVVSIEEKPEQPKSNYCVTGLYFYDNRVCDFAKQIQPSARGELEITDLNRLYLEDGSLNVITLGRGFVWFDTGTVEALFDASEFVRVVERRHGQKVAALEEIAYTQGWIDSDTILASAQRCKKSPYGKHLEFVVKNSSLENAVRVEEGSL
ncbi:MAG: sugar phosphate nucleotidyltransferase, partial [Raoultibacter sp.]